MTRLRLALASEPHQLPGTKGGIEDNREEVRRAGGWERRGEAGDGR